LPGRDAGVYVEQVFTDRAYLRRLPLSRHPAVRRA